MILPDKNITLSNSFIGIGAVLLPELEVTQTISSLWEKMRKTRMIISFEKYILSLDLLYLLNLVEIKEGVLHKKKL